VLRRKFLIVFETLNILTSVNVASKLRTVILMMLVIDFCDSYVP